MQVLWAEQQFIKERTKRSIPADEDPDAPLVRVKRISGFDEEEEEEVVRGGPGRRRRSTQAAKAEELERKFNDELWVHQWYLVGRYRTFGIRFFRRWIFFLFCCTLVFFIYDF